MVDAFFFTIFEGLPRQGPGSDTCTTRAFRLIKDLPRHARILDIGCGSGMQTLALARLCPESTITATDIHQPFLDDLSDRAKKAGFNKQIKTLCGSMDNLPFQDETFDLIWAEGSAFIMGFPGALHSWKRLLKKGGSMGISDLVWFSDTPSDESRKFFSEEYPAILHERDAEALIRDAGYSILDTLRLPDASWWKNYYTPLSRRVETMKQQYRDDQDVQAVLGSIEKEIRMFRDHSREYGYSFFIIRKQGNCT